MCTFLLSFITWEKSLSTHVNVNRCLRSEESDSSFELLAFNERPPWNRVNKVFLFVCNQPRMPCCPSRSNELTADIPQTSCPLLLTSSTKRTEKRAREKGDQSTNVVRNRCHASWHVRKCSLAFFLFLYLSVASIMIIKYLFVWHTHTVALNCNLVML